MIWEHTRRQWNQLKQRRGGYRRDSILEEVMFELSITGQVKQARARELGETGDPYGESLSSHLIRSSMLSDSLDHHLLAPCYLSNLPHWTFSLCLRTTSEAYLTCKPSPWLAPNTHPNETGLLTVFILLFCQDHLHFSLPLSKCQLASPLSFKPLFEIIFLKQPCMWIEACNWRAPSF